jgi:predicted O-methyltransferase YrrM
MFAIKPFQPQADYATVKDAPDAARMQYIADYGYAIVTQESLENLSRFLSGKSVLEVGSGTGFLSAALAEKGIEVTAVDTGSLDNKRQRQDYRRDVTADALSLLPGSYDVVLMMWPTYRSSFAERVADSMRTGQVLVFQGEGWSGNAATDEFFKKVNSSSWTKLHPVTDSLNANHVKFDMVNDQWAVYQKA